jgi:hypothetical protein
MLIHGYVQQVRLLGRGDEFPAHGETDVTALLAATNFHYADVVGLLLEHGADWNAEWGAVGALKVAIGKEAYLLCCTVMVDQHLCISAVHSPYLRLKGELPNSASCR